MSNKTELVTLRLTKDQFNYLTEGGHTAAISIRNLVVGSMNNIPTAQEYADSKLIEAEEKLDKASAAETRAESIMNALYVLSDMLEKRSDELDKRESKLNE